MATKKSKADTVRVAMKPEPTDLKLIAAIRAKTGLNVSNILRIALRKYAEAEGVRVA